MAGNQKAVGVIFRSPVYEHGTGKIHRGVVSVPTAGGERDFFTVTEIGDQPLNGSGRMDSTREQVKTLVTEARKHGDLKIMTFKPGMFES